MDKECYENGSCKICGCATTALQMADKQCDKPCYPKMMSRSIWYQFSNKQLKLRDGKYSWRLYEDRMVYSCSDPRVGRITHPQNI
jgi:phospholipase C